MSLASHRLKPESANLRAQVCLIIALVLPLLCPAATTAQIDSTDVCADPIRITGRSDTLNLVPDIFVRADTIDHIRKKAACVRVVTPGYYQIKTILEYSFDQSNESFYMQVCDPDSFCYNPCDPNLGPYRVVRDMNTELDTVNGYAGTFYLEEGLNTIVMTHYADIALQYPEFINEQFEGTESVHLSQLVFERVDAVFDAGLNQMTEVDSVETGDAYTYHLTLSNNGNQTIHNIRVWDVLPELTTPIAFTVEPDSMTADTLFWSFDSLGVGVNISLDFRVRVTGRAPETPYELENNAWVTGVCDRDESNNFSRSTVVIPAPFYDLRLTMTANRDSVDQGDDFIYNLRIINTGPYPAYDVSLIDVIPDLVTATDFTLPPTSVSSDTLFWRFDSLASQEVVLIDFTVQVTGSPPETPFLLLSRAEISGMDDIDASNDTASVTVIIPAPFYDLQLAMAASRDSVDQGEDFAYHLRVINTGPYPAYDATLTQVIPELVTPTDFSRRPTLAGSDTLFWRFDSLAPREIVLIDFVAKVTKEPPATPFILLSHAGISATNDINASNDTASVTVTIPAPFYDLRLSKAASLNSVRYGDIFNYRIELDNSGPYPAYDIQLWDVLPLHLTALGFDRTPTATRQDTLFWQIDSLMVAEKISFTIGVQFAALLFADGFQLVNTSEIIADADTDVSNNRATAIVDALPQNYDLELAQNVNIDSIRQNDVKPFRYTLHLKNKGPDTAYDVTLSDIIPQNVSFSDFGVAPDQSKGDSLFWHFDSVAANREISIGITATLDDITVTQPLNIVNESVVSGFTDLDPSNNFAATTVTVLPPDDCVYLDRNVFVVGAEPSIGIHFQLSTDRNARLDLYDATGYHIMTIADNVFNAGFSTVDWNGRNTNSQRVGSGVYLITLRSRGLSCWVKVIVVQ